MTDALFIGSCSAFVVSLLFLVYNAIRPAFKYRVNCWFCNRNTWVPGKNRNSFRCPNCEQYNGFGPDGDYNRRITAQHIPKQKQYCLSSGPDVSLRAGFVNGLCEQCNHNQRIIIETLNKFEPLREETYLAEYEDYKFRLNQKYALCTRCQTYSTKKIENDQSKYIPKAASLLSGFSKKASPTVPKGFVPLKKLTSSHKHSPESHAQRKRYSSGTSTDLAHVFTLIASSLLCLANFHHVQSDADSEILPLANYLPLVLTAALPSVVNYGAWIAVASLAVHYMGVKRSQTRFAFGDLGLYVAYPVLIALHMLDVSHDILLSRFAFSAFSFVMSSALVFLPKKLKHRKKPNTMYSAFSVASTPISQCSSALSSRHQSLRLDDTRQHSIRADDSLEMMDYETSSPSKATDRRSRRSASRDATPSRELGRSLIGLQLDDDKPPSVNCMLSGRSSMLSRGAVSPSPQRHGRGPFSSMTYNSAVRKQTSPSLFSVPHSNGSLFGSASAFNAGSVATARSSATSGFPFSTTSQIPNPFADRSRTVHSYGAPSMVSSTAYAAQGTGHSSCVYVAVVVAVVSVLCNAFLVWNFYATK